VRTQQILAEETGVAETIDPLAGSYYIEAMTNWLEEECEKIFARIDEMGGVLAAIEKNYFQREIAKSAYQYQLEIERKERIIVGVNEYVDPDEELEIPILKIDPEVDRRKREQLRQLKAERDNSEVVKRRLAAVTEAARSGSNIMPPILDAVRVYASEGEIIDAMKEVFGEYRETAVF